MIINATHIGKNLDGIGRFSLILAKNFLNRANVLINENALVHFSEEEKKKLKVISGKYSPDYGFAAHLKRLVFTNFIRGGVFNLSQLEVSFWQKKQYVVVHDVIPLLFPEFHKRQYHYFKYLLPIALKNAEKIITVSNHTKEMLIKAYSLKSEKINVIYNGIKLPEEKNIQKENYILYVGRDSPTKNIDRIIQSFEKLHQKYPDWKLYLVGINRKLNNPDIKCLGYMNDEKLDLLYRKAKIFFFPSLYEGFGYPVIEAMARKTAVITSKVSSLPEIASDAALYVDPYSIEDMIGKLEYLIINENERRKLEYRGYLNSKKFNIDIMINRYKELLNENSNSS